jgi:hypothetical protein
MHWRSKDGHSDSAMLALATLDAPSSAFEEKQTSPGMNKNNKTKHLGKKKQSLLDIMAGLEASKERLVTRVTRGSATAHWRKAIKAAQTTATFNQTSAAVAAERIIREDQQNNQNRAVARAATQFRKLSSRAREDVAIRRDLREGVMTVDQRLTRGQPLQVAIAGATGDATTIAAAAAHHHHARTAGSPSPHNTLFSQHTYRMLRVRVHSASFECPYSSSCMVYLALSCGEGTNVVRTTAAAAVVGGDEASAGEDTASYRKAEWEEAFEIEVHQSIDTLECVLCAWCHNNNNNGGGGGGGKKQQTTDDLPLATSSTALKRSNGSNEEAEGGGRMVTELVMASPYGDGENKKKKKKKKKCGRLEMSSFIERIDGSLLRVCLLLLWFW